MSGLGQSDRDFVAELLSRLPTGPSARLRWGGKVTQASPLLVDVGGSGEPVACAHLTTYSPVVDDSVVLVQQAGQYLVLGTYVPSS